VAANDALSFATVRDLARMLRSGETTPTALVEHFAERLAPSASPPSGAATTPW